MTNVASKIIKDDFLKFPNKKIYTIPTCVNLKKNIFYNKNKKKLIITHLGSIGTRYDFDKYLKLNLFLDKKIITHSVIINKNEHKKIYLKMKNHRINHDKYTVKYVTPDHVYEELKKSNFGVFFPIYGFYLKGYFPTKLGEFLSTGTPVITSPINNDVDGIINKYKVGVIIDNYNNNKFEDYYNKILDLHNDDKTFQRCIDVANKYFDINKAIEAYSSIYSKL